MKQMSLSIKFFVLTKSLWVSHEWETTAIVDGQNVMVTKAYILVSVARTIHQWPTSVTMYVLDGSHRRRHGTLVTKR